MVSHREVAERRYAKPPHGSFTPTAVLTEPPPLLEPCDELTSQELWLDGSTIIIPTVIAVSVAYPIPAAGYFAHQKVNQRTKLSWLVLSHIIGTDVSANVYSVLAGTNKVLTIQLPHGNAETKLRQKIFLRKKFSRLSDGENKKAPKVR